MPDRDTAIETPCSHIRCSAASIPEEIAGIARGTREVHATKGDILFHKGDQPTGFHT